MDFENWLHMAKLGACSELFLRLECCDCVNAKKMPQSLRYFILALKHSIHIKRNLGILDAIHCNFIAFYVYCSLTQYSVAVA